MKKRLVLNDGQRQQEIPLAYAEDLPPPRLDQQKHQLLCKCHNIGLARLVWEPYERVLVVLCAETGAPAFGIKVEKRNKLILDAIRPEEVKEEPNA